MQTFSYTARDPKGKVQKGDIEAESEASAAKILFSKNLIPIEVSHAKTGFDNPLNIFKNRVTTKDKVIFARQLATMVKAGLPLSQSLSTLMEQETKPGVKRMLEGIISDVEGGSTLSNALRKFPDTFGNVDIGLVGAGETGGTLDNALLKLANRLEKEYSLVRKIRGAFVYPVIVLVVVAGVLTFLMIVVMPQLRGLYDSFKSELPLLTRILITFSDNFKILGPLTALIIFLSGIGFKAALKNTSFRKGWDGFKTKLYGLKELTIRIYMVRFSSTLASLLGSGVPLLDAISITSKAVGNLVYEDYLNEASEKIKSGVALSDTLKNSDLFPKLVPEMVSVGEKTGEVDNMLNNLSEYYDEEVENAVKNLSTLLEPLIIVVLGIVVAIILVGIMLPIYQITNIAGN